MPTFRVTRHPDRWHWLARTLLIDAQADRARVHISRPVGGDLRLIVDLQNLATLHAGRQQWQTAESIALPIGKPTPGVAWDGFEVYQECVHREAFVCYWCQGGYDTLGDAVSCSAACWGRFSERTSPVSGASF